MRPKKKKKVKGFVFLCISEEKCNSLDWLAAVAWNSAISWSEDRDHWEAGRCYEYSGMMLPSIVFCQFPPLLLTGLIDLFFFFLFSSFPASGASFAQDGYIRHN